MSLKLAIVVQRYGEEVVGGAELHARLVAERLAQRHQVEVLTTCAVDYLTWRNELEPGVSERHGVRVRRFPVARPRTTQGFDALSDKVHWFAHTEAEEKRWMEEHGPVTPALLDHLHRHVDDYAALIFFSYRYWTTYHGLRVAPHKSILVPTAEQDRAVHLGIFKPLFRTPAAYAFNSPEEKDLLLAVTGARELPGEVVGVGIEDKPVLAPDAARRKLDLPGDYIVYVGRIEQQKGCTQLFADFIRFVQDGAPTLSLVLVGKPVLAVPVHVNITHLGVLGEAEKLSVIGASRLLVQPSPYESLSMVLLEAWKVERPVLVNGRCDPMRGQVVRAGGGLYYTSYEEFGATLNWILSHPAEAAAMGRAGRAYFETHYAWPVIMDKYERLLAQVAPGGR